MRKIYFLIASIFTLNAMAQNVNYSVSLINLFAEDNSCISDGFGLDEEVTWHVLAKDNAAVTALINESGNSCYQLDSNIPMSYDPADPTLLDENNSAATLITVSLEAWEDDNASSADRCTYDSGDDCYTIGTLDIPFRNDPMCTANQYTIVLSGFTATVEINWEYTVFTAGPDFTGCGASTNLQGQGSGVWSVVSGSNGGFSSTTDPTTLFSGNENTTYTLRWSRLNGCITNTGFEDVNVTLQGLPVPNLASSESTYCENNNVDFTAQGGSQYDWSVNNETNVLQSSGSNAFSYAPLSGDSKVIVNVINNGCSAKDSVEFTVIPAPTPTISNNGGTLQTQSYSFYQWYFNGSSIGGASSQTYTPSQSGSYSVQVLDGNGCIGESDPFVYNSTDIAEYESTVAIYPNPVKNIVRIEAEQEISQVALVNMIGQKINITLNNNSTDLSSFPDGLYFFHIELENGQKITQKITLSK